MWEAGAAVLEAARLSPSCRRGLGYSSEGARGPAEQSGGQGRSLGPQAEPLVRCVGGGAAAVETRGASREPQQSWVRLEGSLERSWAWGLLNGPLGSQLQPLWLG